MFASQVSKSARGHRRVWGAAAVAALVLAGCGGSDASSDDTGDDDVAADDVAAADGAGTGGDVTAAIADFAFDPTPVEAAAGTTITWTNQDSAPHTVTGTGDLEFDSGNLDEGESFSLTVDEAGEFAYVCTIHGSMQGTIVVS